MNFKIDSSNKAQNKNYRFLFYCLAIYQDIYKFKDKNLIKNEVKEK